MSNKKRTLDLVVTFLSLTKGREKTCRFFQYFSRLIKVILEYVASKSGKKDLLLIADKFNNLGANLALTRKIFRFGNEFRIYASVRAALKEYFAGSKTPEDKYKASKNAICVFARVFSELALGAYYLLDHIVYFNRIGWISDKQLAAKCDILGSKCWMGEVIGSVIGDAVEIHLLKQKIAEEMANSTDKEKTEQTIAEAKKRMDACVYNLIQNLLDFPVTIYFSTDMKVFRPGFVNVLASISSLMGAYTAWPKQ